MQDSLEDYLRISKNTGHDVPDKISKELVVTAQLKKECEARAIKIVEFSIEGKLRPEVFSRCLPFIDRSHYQDIVEERAISKLCGYSICGKRIPDMPKKQYFISTKSNKVYDITERKNFCSNFCYKASLHIQKQIDNNPLWLRKFEHIPEYTFLRSTEGGLPGEYIDQGIVQPAQEMTFTSVNSFAGASLGDIFETETTPGKSRNNKTKGFKKSSRLQSTMQTIKENEIEEEVQVLLTETSKTTTKKYEEKRSHKTIKKESHHKMSCLVNLPSIEENEEKVSERLQNVKENESCVISKQEIKENMHDPKHEGSQRIKPEGIKEQTEEISTSTQSQNSPSTIDIKITEISVKTEPPEKDPTNKIKKQTKKKPIDRPKAVDIESIISRVLDEWLTLDTCIFIHGERKVEQILDEQKLSGYFEELKVSELQREQQIKYMEICRRLHLREMAENKFDSVLTGSQKLKPLPDFKKLKSDTKDMTLKAKSFYDGSLYEQDFPAQVNVSDKDEGNTEQGPLAVLPPVDANSQNLLRRKIFLNSLNKTMQLLLQSLGVTYFSPVLSDVQGLVKTFNLKADNITFKPIVWNYVALILLHLLSLKEESIKEILEEPRSLEYIKVSFELVLNKNKNFIEDMLSNIKNIDIFVERYITKKDSNSM